MISLSYFVLRRLTNIEHIFRAIPKIIDGESTLDIFENRHHSHQRDNSEQEYHSAINNEVVENSLAESKEELKQEVTNTPVEEQKQLEILPEKQIDAKIIDPDEEIKEVAEDASFAIPKMVAPYNQSIINEKVELFKKMMDFNNWVLSSNSGGIPVYSYEGKGNITGLTGSVE